MNYIAGTDLTFEIPLVDASGQSVDATSVEYSVLDGEGLTLLAYTALPGYTAGSDATVTVLATYNTLTGDIRKAAREIVLKCLTANGHALVTKTYVIESMAGTLIRGVNTLVTLASADMLASEMTSVGSWATASTQQKSNALIEAYTRLGNLRLFELDSLYYDYADVNLKASRGSLLDLSQSEVLGLDEKMLAALSQAQVAEADHILSGDPAAESRANGLILDTIGEVKQMYRNSKPLKTPICRRALDYVSKYTSFSSKMLGRA